MTIWDELSPEERCVMINAVEEANLNGIIGDFLGRAEHDGTVWMFSNDEQAIRAMIPRFAAVVLDMIHRDLVEIREPHDGIWDHAAALTRLKSGRRWPIPTRGYGPKVTPSGWSCS